MERLIGRSIILCLGVPELTVQSFLFHQFFMTALLDDPSLIEYQNILAESAGGKPVGDIKGGFPSRMG